MALAGNPGQPGFDPAPIRLIDVDTRESREIGEARPYTGLHFSPDGRFLATVAEGDGGTDLDILEVASGDSVAHLDPGGSMAGMAWSPDSSHLAVVREGETVFLGTDGSTDARQGSGLPAGANPLSWAWTPDSTVFGLITAEGLQLLPLDSSEQSATVARSDFPGDGTDWALRSGAAPRELGLDDLAPISGNAEARAEYPVTLQPDGSVDSGEARLVSIYDWNTLPSPGFDAATSQQFAAVRKTCDPCRSADGSGSLILIWVAQGQPTPTPSDTEWPAGTQTLLAIETGPASATAYDLGIEPAGAIDVDAWRPIYDVVIQGGG